jgi:hypothetical protein
MPGGGLRLRLFDDWRFEDLPRAQGSYARRISRPRQAHFLTLRDRSRQAASFLSSTRKLSRNEVRRFWEVRKPKLSHHKGSTASSVTATSTSEDRLMVNFSFGLAMNCENTPTRG